MTKKEKFIKFVEELIEPLDMSAEFSDVMDYFNTLRETEEKPMFTDNGKIILAYMQTVPGENLKAKDIAENLGVSARTVSGAMRKLVTDGFIEKLGKDPIVYSITTKGKEITID